MQEPTMFAVGFACGVIAAVIGLILVLSTLRGSGGGRRNPPPPASYQRVAPPPSPPAPGKGYQPRPVGGHGTPMLPPRKP